MNFNLPDHALICRRSSDDMIEHIYGWFTYVKMNALYSTMQRWKNPHFKNKQEKFYMIEISYREQ